MATKSCIDFVPDDLLSQIFNFFTLAELVHLMPVSRRWRALVIDHRTYWMQIDLTQDDRPSLLNSATAAEIRLFSLRLSRSAPKPTSVTVSCNNADTVLPLIASHLSHMVRMHIMTSLPLAAEVLAALCHAAPILEQLSLYFYDGSTDCMPVAVPVNLFDFDAPALKHAFFTSVFLKAPLAPALQHVEHLVVGGMVVLIPGVLFEIPDVFSACPNLRQLSLYEDVNLDPIFWQPDVWRKIESVSFFTGVIGRTWHLLQLPILEVPSIDVNTDQPGIMLPILAGHLDGPLTLVGTAFADDGRFDVSLKSIGKSGRERTRRLCALLTPDNPRVLAEDGMWSRVVCIILAIESWDDYVPFFGLLPALEDVVIVELLGWNPPSLTATLSCPALKRLSLRNRRSLDPETVSIEYLAQLASRVLQGAPFPLDLHLGNMRFEGAPEAVAATFRSITVNENVSSTSV